MCKAENRNLTEEKMAKIETIKDDLGKPLDIINIDSSVGANGVNDTTDIQVIKALFKFVPTYHVATGANKITKVEIGIGKQASWNISRKLLPSPYDGTVWGVAELTRSFQKYANSKLSAYGYQVSVSGTMKPAKGYAVVGRKFSTIAALNIFAALSVRSSKTLIEHMADEYEDIFRNVRDDT